MTPEDAFDELAALWLERAQLLRDLKSRTRRRPMIGGCFGHDGYLLCTLQSERAGLDALIYFVLHARSGTAISFTDSKQDALAWARRTIGELPAMALQRLYAHIQVALEKEHRAAEQVWADKQTKFAAAHPDRVAMGQTRVPKRRLEIFEKSGGKCHYCSTALTLGGKWHIEHMMPRALLGGNETHNLVAACVPCNMKKKDKTDMEFIAQREAEVA